MKQFVEHVPDVEHGVEVVEQKGLFTLVRLERNVTELRNSLEKSRKMSFFVMFLRTKDLGVKYFPYTLFCFVFNKRIKETFLRKAF